MILYRHVLKEHIFPFFFSLAILIFISAVQYAIQILDSIIGKGLDPAVILELFIINLGWIIALAVPMAVLTATLMAFGRMSADNEIMAIKSAGVGMTFLLTPVLILALIGCAGLIFFNDLVLPDANHRTANLMSDISRKRPAAFIEPGVLIRDFENYALYVSGSDGATGKLKGIKIFSSAPGENPSVTTADSGDVNPTPDGAYLKLRLLDGETHSIDPKEAKQYFISRFREQVVFVRNPDSDLHRSASSYRSDRELNTQSLLVEANRYADGQKALLVEYNAALDSMASRGIVWAQHRQDSTLAPYRKALDSVGSFFEWKRLPGINAQTIGLRTAEEAAGHERLASRITNEQKNINQYLVEAHKKFAIPVACIVFALIGAPLGIMARKGGLGVGASYSVLFFILYWAFLIQGEALADRALIGPFWAMWSANILIGIAGLYLLFRMTRETTFLSISPFVKVWASIVKRWGHTFLIRLIGKIAEIPGLILSFPFLLTRAISGILSVYVVRIFLGFTFGLLTAVLTIFLVVDYVSNTGRYADVPFSLVGKYYLYYLPWIIQTLLPIILLLSSMFTMGSLIKNSELTAMKAAGKSIRRITLPMLFMGIVFVAASFYLSEGILPRANVKRQAVYDQMKESRLHQQSGTNRSQREYRRNFYYFGRPDVLYGYDEFRTVPQQARGVWRIVYQKGLIAERIQAASADFSNGKWSFVNGTRRIFEGGNSSLTAFDTLTDSVLTTTPSAMVAYIKMPEEMSYTELSDFIDKTRRRGEKISKYLTDLDFKIAYPFMNFIVILLGIAITARTSKKGGAVLLGTGLGIVFIYWILCRFALSFGRTGQIDPLVGAWVGNVVFLLLGLWLYKEADR